MRSKELAKVISQECIGTGVYSMWIETKAADTAVAGQFISVYCNDKTKLLPRPISICQVDKENGRLRIVYRVVGGGTTEMSTYKHWCRTTCINHIALNCLFLYGINNCTLCTCTSVFSCNI